MLTCFPPSPEREDGNDVKLLVLWKLLGVTQIKHMERCNWWAGKGDGTDATSPISEKTLERKVSWAPSYWGASSVTMVGSLGRSPSTRIESSPTMWLSEGDLTMRLTDVPHHGPTCSHQLPLPTPPITSGCQAVHFHHPWPGLGGVLLCSHAFCFLSGCNALADSLLPELPGKPCPSCYLTIYLW